MFAADLAATIPGAKRRGEWFDTKCPVPAHGGDARPSLSFRDDATKQRIALHCRKGCKPPEIASGFGLTLADLHHGPAGNGARPRVVAEYLYTDERGAVLFAVERLHPKDFRQKRPTRGGAGWDYGLANARRVVFGFPEIQAAGLVYVVEGERDVLTLRAAGLVATCNPMGAGKWTADYARQLADAGVRDVRILPDHDDAGRGHAAHVAASCAAAGLVVKVIALPGLPPKGDVTDWFTALGHTPAELVELATSAAVWTPGEASKAPTVWSLAKSAEELIAAGGVTLEAVDYPLAARGSITEINAPRGTGKSAVVLARMVAQARHGLRVLFLDRDNSPATLRKRLVGLGAGAVPSLKVLTRDVAPSFADGVAWGAFPLEHFDVVVIDSWDTFAEGAGEQDSRRSTLALASLLDMVRRERAPAVILLCNVTKDGAAGRGSGTLEDRADNVFEVRDATGYAPTGKRPWWEELPPAARSEWAARATRRAGPDRPERIRLAFIASKFRDDDDPAPFVLELDFTSEPCALRDVTAELVAAGDGSRAAELARATQAREQAAAVLVAELGRRSSTRPLLVKAAEALLGAHGLKQRAARELLKSDGDGRWRLEALDGRSVGVILADSVRFPGGSTVTESVGICTVERVSAFPKAVDRMNTGQPLSDRVDPAKHAGGRVSANAVVENGYTRDRGDEGEV